MKSKSLKSIAIVLGGAACISAANLSAAGQHETGGSSVPGSRDTSGQTTMPGQPSTMPGSGTGIGGAGPSTASGNTSGSATGSTQPSNTPGSATSTLPGAATGTGQPSTLPGAGAGTDAAMPQSDAEILGIVMAIDDHEIAAAKAAAKEKMGAQAKDYSKMLKKQHTQNSDKVKKLAKKMGISPTSNRTATDLRAKGTQELATLTPLEGKEFEKAYIDAMVTGHTEALQVIDAQLLPAAKSDEVREHLGEFRGHVSAHLEQGKRLQGVQASRTE